MMDGVSLRDEACEAPILGAQLFGVVSVPGNSGHLAKRPSWKDRSPYRLMSIRGMVSLLSIMERNEDTMFWAMYHGEMSM